MSDMQVYASEMSKFSYADKGQTVLVAGEGIQGVPVTEITADIDPKALVGAKASTDPIDIEVGSKWQFRAENPVVESKNGGLFAFLTPQL